MDWSDNNDETAANSVVEMSDIQQRIRYAPLSQIEAYWNTLRGTRLMPQRSEIDPRGLKGCLEYCFVLERIAPGLARLRVAGSHLGDLMGMEVRGMPISSFLSAASRDQFGRTLEEVFETPSTATVDLSAETGFGRPEMAGRLILLPVRSDLGDVSRILGGFVTSGDMGRAPRRFNVDRIKLSPITGVDSTVRTGRPPLAQDSFVEAEQRRRENDRRRAERRSEDLAPGLAEDSQEFEQALPGVPYLRVVK